jgi:endonuclease YncB( thermonuclease family)
MGVRGSVGCVICACLVAHGCGRDATADAPGVLAQSSRPVDTTLAATEEPHATIEEGLVIGEFRLAPDPVVDGDTIRVEGLEGSIRLLSIDTEEPVKSKRDRADIEASFEEYLLQKRGRALRPTKAGTPMGDQATEFARRFFEGAETVRLERDDPKTLRGRYGRVLAYAFVRKDGKWTSYNVEAVRAGMTPYFTKYGYSHRFHNQFARAEAEAREAKRGIWDPNAQSYGDYHERRDWWDARAKFIQAFEHDGTGRDDFIVLTQWDAESRLEDALGREVTVLGVIDRVKHFKTLVRVSLSTAQRHVFPIIFRDRAVFHATGIARFRGEPVTVRGTVERYRRGSYETLQIVVTDSGQVHAPALPWPDERAEAAE